MGFQTFTQRDIPYANQEILPSTSKFRITQPVSNAEGSKMRYYICNDYNSLRYYYKNHSLAPDALMGTLVLNNNGGTPDVDDFAFGGYQNYSQPDMSNSNNLSPELAAYGSTNLSGNGLSTGLRLCRPMTNSTLANDIARDPLPKFKLPDGVVNGTIPGANPGRTIVIGGRFCRDKIAAGSGAGSWINYISLVGDSSGTPANCCVFGYDGTNFILANNVVAIAVDKLVLNKWDQIDIIIQSLSSSLSASLYLNGAFVVSKTFSGTFPTTPYTVCFGKPAIPLSSNEFFSGYIRDIYIRRMQGQAGSSSGANGFFQNQMVHGIDPGFDKNQSSGLLMYAPLVY